MNAERIFQPTYANVVGIRTTPAELILEFGCVFGASQDAPGPENVTPSVCLVLPIASIQSLSRALTTAAEEHDKKMKAMPTPETTFAVKEALG